MPPEDCFGDKKQNRYGKNNQHQNNPDWKRVLFAFVFRNITHSQLMD
jgi:hypothetical protein